jgi:hypothetical protein
LPPGALCPDQHRGLAVTGSPAPIYSLECTSDAGIFQISAAYSRATFGGGALWGLSAGGHTFSVSRPAAYSSREERFGCGFDYTPSSAEVKSGAVLHGFFKVAPVRTNGR